MSDLTVANTEPTEPVEPVDAMEKVYRRRQRLLLWPIRGLALLVLAAGLLAGLLLLYLRIVSPHDAAKLIASQPETGRWQFWAQVLYPAALAWWICPSLMMLPFLRRWVMGAPSLPDERETAADHLASHHALQILTYTLGVASAAVGFLPALDNLYSGLAAAFVTAIAARIVGQGTARFFGKRVCVHGGAAVAARSR